jgi:hypothetical protein
MSLIRADILEREKGLVVGIRGKYPIWSKRVYRPAYFTLKCLETSSAPEGEVWMCALNSWLSSPQLSRV